MTYTARLATVAPSVERVAARDDVAEQYAADVDPETFIGKPVKSAEGKTIGTVRRAWIEGDGVYGELDIPVAD